MSSIPIVSIVGKSNSGKTTLLEKVIGELKRRGYRIATIKHHFHPGFEIDLPGKDTWRLAQAGSDIVILAAPDKIARIERLQQSLSLDEIVAQIHNVDIILTEGFKSAGKPAIEVLRAEQGVQPITNRNQLIALACDVEIQAEVPVFHLNDTSGITSFIEERLFKK